MNRSKGIALFVGIAVLGGVIARVAITALNASIGEAASWVILTMLLLSVPIQIMVRRGRNKRLTGSPTEWPDSDRRLM